MNKECFNCKKKTAMPRIVMPIARSKKRLKSYWKKPNTVGRRKIQLKPLLPDHIGKFFCLDQVDLGGSDPQIP